MKLERKVGVRGGVDYRFGAKIQTALRSAKSYRVKIWKITVD